MNDPSATGHDPYAALRLRDFRFYLVGNLLAALGMQMQTVAVGWEIYHKTASYWALACLGLAQWLPAVVLAVPAGYLVDRLDRQRIIMAAVAAVALASLGLALISASGADSRWMYAPLLVVGVARAFLQPGKAAFLPLIVPRDAFSNAVTWNTGGFHLASILGPALGGLLLVVWGAPAVVYVLDALAAGVMVALLSRVTPRPQARTLHTASFKGLVAGLQFVYRRKLILAVITLDMFAVLLGGATMLFPVYAEDILRVGPSGLGWMRAAPALGALAMAFFLAYRPPLKRAGPALLWAVAGFGVATMVFGLSRSYWLSLAMLFLTGALDNISVVVRHTLVQLLTPDEMRGRVAAVNSLFIGASNELGGFESGAVAALFGPTVSVVSGGLGTLVVVAVVALACPQVRRFGPLAGQQQAEEPAEEPAPVPA